MADQQMRCDVDLDWSTFYCPCGASLCTRYEGAQSINAWFATHKPHTNGEMLSHTTPDGNRVYGEPEPDRVTPL